MPVYEYRCRSCGRRFSRLVGVVAEESGPECPRCGGASVDRIFSRFSRLRGEDEVLDRLADPSSVGDPDDPASLKRWMREMGKEMGEDIADEFEEILESEETEGGAGTDDEA